MSEKRSLLDFKIRAWAFWAVALALPTQPHVIVKLMTAGEYAALVLAIVGYAIINLLAMLMVLGRGLRETLSQMNARHNSEFHREMTELCNDHLAAMRSEHQRWLDENGEGWKRGGHA